MNENIRSDDRERSMWREMVDVAAQAIVQNRAAGRCITLAESCSGGMAMAALTATPGASDVFDRGFVVYSDQSKMDMLDVSSDLIQTFGSVSVACAWAMAVGALKHSDADVAVSVTGIAGPGGGSDKKPVGTVVFGRAVRGQDPSAVHTDRVIFESQDRDEIRRLAALHALKLLSPSYDPVA